MLANLRQWHHRWFIHLGCAMHTLRPSLLAGVHAGHGVRVEPVFSLMPDDAVASMNSLPIFSVSAAPSSQLLIGPIHCCRCPVAHLRATLRCCAIGKWTARPKPTISYCTLLPAYLVPLLSRSRHGLHVGSHELMYCPLFSFLMMCSATSFLQNRSFRRPQISYFHPCA